MLRCCFLAFVFLALLPAAAGATVRDDGAIARVVPITTAAKSGDVARATIEIHSRPDVVIEDVAISTPRGWSKQRLSSVPNHANAKIDDLVAQSFELSIQAGNPSEPLVLSYYADGQFVEEEFRLGNPTVPMVEIETVQEPVPSLSAQRIAELARPEGADKPFVAAVAKTTRNIRVHGRIVCRRMDSTGITTLGVDNVKIKVHDDEGSFVSTQIEDFTNVDGYFDMTFPWDDGDPFDPQPDIVLEVEMANSWVQMRTTDITSGNTSFRFNRIDDFTGTDIDVGTFSIVDPALNDAMYVMTTVARAWRWHDSMGFSVPTTTFRFPNADGSSFFRPLDGVIYIGQGDQFSDEVVVHEHGHRWVRVFAQQNDPNYCNGICNSDMPRCFHCLWCQETTGTAWSEGFPDALGDFIPRTFNTYAVGPASAYNFESLGTCGQGPAGGGVDDPTMTEGIFAAYLVDLVDTNDENDTALEGTWQDRTQLDPMLLMEAANVLGTLTAQEFVDDFYTRLKVLGTSTATLEDVWETARQNGYELDAAVPNNPGFIQCSTHSAGVSTRANWPQFSWSTPSDDASGISGYAISITSGGPGLPSAVQNIGKVNTYRTQSPLNAGSYYFNLRTVDRAGRWNPGYRSFGPIVILSPQATDFVGMIPEFWEDIAVPRNDTGGNPGQVFLPTALTGYSNATYLNAAYRNSSVSSLIVPNWNVEFRVDNVYLNNFAHSGGVVAAGQEYLWNSNGGTYVRGGRHTLSLVLDSTESVGESSELNNRYGRQWIWSPRDVAAPGSFLNITIPRERTAGWNDIPSGSTNWFNVDGYRMNTGAGGHWWHAVVLLPPNNDDNFELRMHAASTGPQDGFAGNVGFSARPSGRLEALFTNRNNVGTTNYDVGVMNVGVLDLGSSMRLSTVGATGLAYDSDVTVSLGTEEHLAMREIWVPAANVGPFSARVSIEPTDDPVTLLWLDAAFTTGDILDYVAAVTTDADGFAQLDVNVATSNYYCLVIYREGSHVPAKASAAMDIALSTGTTPPNLRPDDGLTSWAAPLVPRAAADGTPNSVPAPTVLNGDVASTYLNLASINDRSIASPASSAAITLDGNPMTTLAVPDLGAFGSAAFNGGSPFVVRGGRHTLVAKLDPTGLIEEAREDDNSYGAQWVFQPASLVPNVTLLRAAPPEPLGGLFDVTVTITPGDGTAEGGGDVITPVFPNCDGVRLPTVTPVGNDNQWLAVAAMSNEKSNAELLLHEASTGPENGFAESLTNSTWGEAQSDFVLINQRGQTPRPFDVGVLREGAGQETYSVHSTSSDFLSDAPFGNFGPYSMPANRIVRLHEVWLDEGSWNLALVNVTGTVDWGLSVHPPFVGDDRPWMGKSDTLAEAASWFAPAGGDENASFSVPQGGAGYHCIAVWKTKDSELAKSGDYELVFSGTVTAVDDQLPGATWTQLEVSPNPFNPRTEVAFELPRREDVRVEVLNQRGSRVTTLHTGELASGRHVLTFDGHDASGRSLASGVYFVRLLGSSGQQQVRKVTLLK